MATQKEKKKAGGLGDIKVVSKEVQKTGKEKEAEPEPTEEELIEQLPDQEPEGLSEETIAVNKAVIETICLAVGHIAVALTGVEEVAFDESETEQLKSLWSPFMPSISPIATAVIGTVVIVGGKVGVYMGKKRGIGKKGKSAKSEKPPKTKQEVEVKEK